MVFIVKHIDKVSIEGVDLFNLGERVENISQPVVDCLLTEFDLP